MELRPVYASQIVIRDGIAAEPYNSRHLFTNPKPWPSISTGSCSYSVSRKIQLVKRLVACSTSVDSATLEGVSGTQAEADKLKEFVPECKGTIYRPVVILPGLGNNTEDYDSLATALVEKGIRVFVPEIRRIDWLRNIAGILDSNYWKGTLRPRPVLDWYFKRMENAISEAKASTPDKQISLVGHSAGGWLARVYMSEFGHSDIALLITLGTPHCPLPKGIEGVFDQTRGLLNYVEETCPGAFHAPDVKYVCLAGRYLKGGKFSRPKDPEIVAMSSNGDSPFKPDIPSYRERFVGQSYKQVCGYPDVWGDGVVPEISAHLEGAVNLTLEGAYHSPVGSNEERQWYGSRDMLEQWAPYLLE